MERVNYSVIKDFIDYLPMNIIKAWGGGYIRIYSGDNKNLILDLDPFYEYSSIYLPFKKGEYSLTIR